MEKVGLIQMTSGPDAEQNLAYIQTQVALLAEQGAALVVTPENALVFGSKRDYHRVAESFGSGPLQQAMSELARKHQIWLVVGSMPIRRESGVTTTCLVFDPQGQCQASYDKLHMFDVDVADGHRHYRESETFTPGNEVKLVHTPFANIGLSICYDLRFPHLYTELRNRGAELILVPAAFTAVTGRAHWQSLLRARAIENQCWVLAVNQTGHHPCGRETWGHSMLIDPWGEVVADAGSPMHSMLAQLDISKVNDIRSAMPVSQHNRFENQFKSKSTV
ncbi:carbon-nitrogen hydrolase family protein [Vibrio sp.]|uniref:carbon-nitrogen hydrolase family protein n=1 Tax=Vibrio sp. TaxID=678 RepID=UPI003D132A68